mmetsp:Transcript_46314/g.88386  ORF Transcript_46314/g.88386 Transcript_46314/m.88386 type:complete len:206 (+) Transcript_46314:608-1225(+)
MRGYNRIREQAQQVRHGISIGLRRLVLRRRGGVDDCFEALILGRWRRGMWKRKVVHKIRLALQSSRRAARRLIECARKLSFPLALGGAGRCVLGSWRGFRLLLGRGVCRLRGRHQAIIQLDLTVEVVVQAARQAQHGLVLHRRDELRHPRLHAPALLRQLESGVVCHIHTPGGVYGGKHLREHVHAALTDGQVRLELIRLLLRRN